MKLLPACLIVLAVSGNCGADEFPSFRALTIDANADQVVYAVTTADVNNDTLPDIVALTNRAAYWYEAPTWQRHTLFADQTEPDNVCIAAHDIDGDGLIDFAIGAGWTRTGTIQWASRGGQIDGPWLLHQIGVERWTHRMRFADVLGTGKAQLVVSPLNKTAGDGVRLTAFEIPARPQTSRWPATVLDASLNRMHNHWHTDLDRDGSPDTLTASVAGVHLIRRTKTGWSKTQIGTGIRDGKTTGAGEVKTGRSADGGRFLVTIEPMHGHTIAVYTPNPTGELWQRRVVETELSRGHAIWVANLDDDPADEIVFGHSDRGPGSIAGPGIFVLDATDNTATTWKKYVVDNGGIATEDAVVADLNGDGHADIVAGGRATHNVKLYLNRPAK